MSSFTRSAAGGQLRSQVHGAQPGLGESERVSRGCSLTKVLLSHARHATKKVGMLYAARS